MAQVQAPDVLRLQQELVEKERKLQHAITIAGQYQARVLDLEDRIDSKNDVKEKVKKLIHKFEQHKREITARQDNEQIEQENADLRRNETSLIAIVKDLRGILRKKGADEALSGPAVIGNEEKEEPIESEDDNQLSTLDSMEEQIEDEELLNDNVVSEIDGVDIREPNEIEIDSLYKDNSEYVDEIYHSEIDGNVPVDSMDDVLEREEVMEKTPGNPKEASVERDIEWRTSGRPARRTAKVVKYNDPLEDSDGDETPPVKKTRMEPEKKGKKGTSSKKESTKADSSMKFSMTKLNATELECPECEYRTRSVCGWATHLSKTHSTNAREASLAFRCDCGVECFSYKHISKCEIANVTVIRQSDMITETKRKLNDSELECPECEYRTRSVIGWVRHLKQIHSSTPSLAGLALRCDCGVESFSDKHFLKCEIANVKVIRKSDMVKEPKMAKLNNSELECPECEHRTRSVSGWVCHLIQIHSITPSLAGLALRCDCGHVGLSDNHSRTCDSTNTTVIRKKQETPKCILCEAHPKTIRGFTNHLQRQHKTTMMASGIYLKCACELKLSSHHSLLKHNKETSQSFAEEGYIKEEEKSDDEVESHFAMSSFFSPARSEFPRSVAPEPIDRVKEEDIDQETGTEKECKKDFSVEGGIQCRINRRPSRNASRSVKLNETLEAFDGDEAPPVKKSRTKSEKNGKRNSSNKESSLSDSAMKEPKVAKRNDSDLQCPECEYHTRSVRGWEFHLSKIHLTTAKQAGLALRCECGVDCLSEHHFRTCKSANATVIKIDDKKESKLMKRNDSELECPKCEYRTRSVIGWMDHLSRIHSTTPNMAGLALRCDCGHEGNSNWHSKLCESTNTIVIHKKDMKKKETPQCVLCEAYPTTPRGYSNHLQIHHQTTLKARGIYLTCACDWKVTSRHSFLNHKKECDGCHFTLHKLLED